jgi:hypothetical protein
MKTTNIRFYEEKDKDSKAWEILHNLNKEKFKSQSEFVVCAILDYYERYLKTEADPYLETREKEDVFTERIVNAVEKKVLSNIPALVGMYFTQFQVQGMTLSGQTPLQVTVPIKEEETLERSEMLEEEPEENELLDFDMF